MPRAVPPPADVSTTTWHVVRWKVVLFIAAHIETPVAPLAEPTPVVSTAIVVWANEKMDAVTFPGVMLTPVALADPFTRMTLRVTAKSIDEAAAMVMPRAAPGEEASSRHPSKRIRAGPTSAKCAAVLAGRSGFWMPVRVAWRAESTKWI